MNFDSSSIEVDLGPILMGQTVHDSWRSWRNVGRYADALH